MNLLDIPNSPLAEEDLELLLRALLHANSAGYAIGVSYNPNFASISPWMVSLHTRHMTHCISGEGQTLAAAFEQAFEKMQTYRLGHNRCQD